MNRDCLMLLVLFLQAGLLFELTMSQAVCRVVRRVTNEQQTWDFSGFVGNPAVAVVSRQEFGNTDNVTWSYQFSFCDKVQSIVDTDITKETNQNKWLGWSHGMMEGFFYVGPSVYTRVTTDEERTVKRNSRTVVRMFEQEFRYGDQGYPCLQRRFAVVSIYCGNNGDTCRSVPNVGQDNCLDGKMPTTQVPCICNVAHDPEFHPCSVNLTVLLIGCPHVRTDYTPTAPPFGPNVSGGQVFGIIILVLFLIVLLVFVGGYVYNYKVKNLRGLDAVPFISVCRGRGGPEYTPAPTSSSYGSVAN
jgi:hypothetical protein